MSYTGMLLRLTDRQQQASCTFCISRPCSRSKWRLSWCIDLKFFWPQTVHFRPSTLFRRLAAQIGRK